MQHFGPFMRCNEHLDPFISCNQKHMSCNRPISKFAFLEQLAIPENKKENIEASVEFADTQSWWGNRNSFQQERKQE